MTRHPCPGCACEPESPPKAAIWISVEPEVPPGPSMWDRPRKPRTSPSKPWKSKKEPAA